jgi:hypothetical protein
MGAARQTVSRERIRGPELAVLRTRLNGTAFDKAVPEVDAGNLVMASNKRLTAALVGSNEWQKIRNAFVCHTGTHTGYIEPNTVFDEKSLLVINDRELEKLAGTRYFVEYVDPQTKEHWLYPVHPDYLGKQNSILVAEHPNYTLKQDGNRVITLPAGMSLKDAVDLVEGFPAEDGWNRGDPNHHIPVMRTDGPELYLWRASRLVGPAGRDGFGERRDVGLDVAPSDGRGVVVEAAEGSASVEAAIPVSSTTDSRLIRISPTELRVDGTFTGTSAQLDAAVRLLSPLGQK